MPEPSAAPTLVAHLGLNHAHPENVAVEALGFILRRSPAARDALGGLLRDGRWEVGPLERVETQRTDDEGGRPDLAVLDPGGRPRVLIEGKFGAPLTWSNSRRVSRRRCWSWLPTFAGTPCGGSFVTACVRHPS